MSAAKSEYRRLPGRTNSLTERNSLWLAEDHVLKVRNVGYSEEYRRFYLKDVQAFTLYRTATRTVWNIVYGVLAGMIVIIGIATGSATGMGVALFFCIFPVIFILLNTLLGPTCGCRIRTAVQEDRLPSAGRMRSGLRLVNTLRPLIMEAQAADRARLEAEALEAQARRAGAPAAADPLATNIGTTALGSFDSDAPAALENLAGPSGGPSIPPPGAQPQET